MDTHLALQERTEGVWKVDTVAMATPGVVRRVNSLLVMPLVDDTLSVRTTSIRVIFTDCER